MSNSEDSDQVLEDLKNKHSPANTSNTSLKKPTAHSNSQFRKSSPRPPNNKQPQTTTKAPPNNIARSASNASSNNASANFLRNRFSARRIGGPDFSVHNRSLQSLGMDSPGGPQPTSLGGRSGSAVPMPVDLGGYGALGRRGSFEVGRERAKSSVSNISGAFEKYNGPEIIIRYGELLKKSVVSPTWKKKFFVLTDKNLYYYDLIFEVPVEFQNIDIKPKGQISLSLVEDCKKEQDASATKFNILTPSRNYRLQMETGFGADAWVSAITGACENIKQQLHPNSTRMSRKDSFSSVRADELETMPQNAFRDPAKMVKEARALKGKGGDVHTPADIGQVVNWSPFDVAAWLYTVDLSKYSELFYQNNVDGKTLKELSKKQDVVNLGVEDADAMKVLNAVEMLNSLHRLEVQQQQQQQHRVQ